MSTDGAAAAAAALAAGRVRAAADAIEENAGATRGRTRAQGRDDRSRSGGLADVPRDGAEDSTMVFDVESNTMVPKESLPEDRPATKSHVMGLLDMFKKDLSTSFEKATENAIKASHDSLKAEIFEHVGQLLSAYDAQSQKRFSELEGAQGEQNEQLSQHDRDIDTLRKDIARLQEQLGVAANANPTRNQLAAVGWDDPADPTILLLNSENNTPITKAAAVLGISEWLKDSNISDKDWSLEGDELDRRFTIRFRGEAGYAAIRAKQAFGSIRGPDGFRPLSARTPTGTGSVKLYVKPNQNAKERKLELDSKRFFRAVQAKITGKKVSWVKREGTISIDWRLVARVQVHPGDAPSTIMYNMAAMRDLGLEKSLFTEAFANIGSSSKVEWSL